MLIRRSIGEDFAEMWQAFHAVAAAGDTLPFSEEFGSDAFRLQWMESSSTTYVAAGASSILGMYQWSANRTGRGAHVATATYVVKAAHQGQGVGRALVKHSIAEARNAGFVAMQFNYVVSTNAAAIHLYQSFGFKIVGTLPKAFRHKDLDLVDAHVMYLLL